jgi:hypothetical protein
MNLPALSADRIVAMPDEAIAKVRALENAALQMPQIKIDTHHILHGGMYSRTIMIPAGVLLTGALIKKATLLVVNGDAWVYIGDQTKRVCGYAVYAASAHRKQAFVAVADTILTMIFPTSAKTVAEAEAEFTDETDLLMSRQEGAVNTTTITEE